MRATVGRFVGAFPDQLREARTEAALALLRGTVCLVAGLILVFGVGGDPQLSPGVAHLGVAALSVGLAMIAARAPTAGWASAFGRWSTAADVAMFAGYSMAFHDRPGAGSLFGVFVLVIGPVRYGLRGLAVTAGPVALIAILWPQADVLGNRVPVFEVLTLCLLFALPAVVVRSVVLRGSARLRQAEQQFATAFEHASIGMVLTDLDLHVLQANRALGVLVGQTPAGLLGTRLDAVVDAADRERVTGALLALTRDEPSTRIEARLRRADGGLRWGHLSASLLSGSKGLAPRVVVQIENITERKRSEALLSHAAAHDSLTDLPNRNLLLARLDTALRQGEQVGVLFLDLDRFKVVNDGLGHAAGDLLLVQVALRLRDVMRPDDLVARLGGDEFVVLCRQADETTCRAIAARVLEVLTQPVSTVSGELVIGASIGIALAGPGDSAETVLRDADTAMYAAKAAGGGRTHVFNATLREAVIRTHEMEIDLRVALHANQLSMAYQPVVSLPHGQVIGCEALARWKHPVRGAVSPQEFINVAEQSDLILELGDWVLRRALRDAASWPAAAGSPHPTVAVNVSIRQLADPGFVGRVADILKESAFDPTRLTLEVTETALGGEVESIIEALTALRDVGVRLSIDDFGTGHASLTYLARFPVDQVKIDRSFVAGLGIDAGSQAIVGGVVGMAHTFDLRVIAEGVETEAQLNGLHELGCDAVQGYLLGMPMPNAELTFLLRRHASEGIIPMPRQGDVVQVTPQHRSYDETRLTHLLVEGAKQVTGRLDLDAVLEHTFVAVAKAVSFTGGSILLVEGQEIRIAAGLPAPTEDALAARIPLGQGVSGAIASTGEPRYLPDITIASTVTSGRRAKSASTGVRSWYGVPLIAEGRPIGVLQLDSVEVDAFSEAERMAVLAFAPVVALALITARNSAKHLRTIQDGG